MVAFEVVLVGRGKSSCSTYIRPVFWHVTLYSYVHLYSWSNSTKFPASDADNVREHMLTSQITGGGSERKSVCFCSQSSGGASIRLLT
jgi:hypothetical protein